MTTGILTNIGEEWIMKTDVSGVSQVTVGLYNDGTGASASNPTEATDLLDAEGPDQDEPDGNDYARVTNVDITTAKLGTDWGFDNDSQISFNVSDATTTVNAYFIVVNFNSTEAGDTMATDHLIATGALSQSRDLSQIDTLNISAGDGTNGVGLKLS